MNAFRFIFLAVVLVASAATSMALLVPDASSNQLDDALDQRAHLEAQLLDALETSASATRDGWASRIAMHDRLVESLSAPPGFPAPRADAMFRQASNRVWNQQDDALDIAILLGADGDVIDARSRVEGFDADALVREASIRAILEDNEPIARFVGVDDRLFAVNALPVIASTRTVGAVVVAQEYDSDLVADRRSGLGANATYFFERNVIATTVTDPTVRAANDELLSRLSHASVGIPSMLRTRDSFEPDADSSLGRQRILLAPVYVGPQRDAGDELGAGVIIAVEGPPHPGNTLEVLRRTGAFRRGVSTTLVVFALGLIVFFGGLVLLEGATANAAEPLARHIREAATANDPQPVVSEDHPSSLHEVAKSFNAFLEAYRAMSPAARRVRQESQPAIDPNMDASDWRSGSFPAINVPPQDRVDDPMWLAEQRAGVTVTEADEAMFDVIDAVPESEIDDAAAETGMVRVHTGEHVTVEQVLRDSQSPPVVEDASTEAPITDMEFEPIGDDDAGEDSADEAAAEEHTETAATDEAGDTAAPVEDAGEADEADDAVAEDAEEAAAEEAGDAAAEDAAEAADDAEEAATDDADDAEEAADDAEEAAAEEADDAEEAADDADDAEGAAAEEADDAEEAADDAEVAAADDAENAEEAAAEEADDAEEAAAEEADDAEEVEAEADEAEGAEENEPPTPPSVAPPVPDLAADDSSADEEAEALELLDLEPVEGDEDAATPEAPAEVWQEEHVPERETFVFGEPLTLGSGTRSELAYATTMPTMAAEELHAEAGDDADSSVPGEPDEDESDALFDQDFLEEVSGSVEAALDHADDALSEDASDNEDNATLFDDVNAEDAEAVSDSLEAADVSQLIASIVTGDHAVVGERDSDASPREQMSADVQVADGHGFQTIASPAVNADEAHDAESAEPAADAQSLHDEADDAGPEEPVQRDEPQTVPRVSVEELEQQAETARAGASSSVLEQAEERMRALRPDGAAGVTDEHRELYQSFVDAKDICGEDTSKLTYPRFVGKIERNREALKRRYGCRDVQFKVQMTEGRVTLKATPIR